MRKPATIAFVFLLASMLVAEEPAWHDVTRRLPEQIEECPARMQLEIGRLLEGEKKAELRTGTPVMVRCEGASISNLVLTREKSPYRHIVIQPWVKLRPGRDKLALIDFEVRQGDQVLGRAETAVPLDEGDVNWEDPVRLLFLRLPVPPPAPQPVLRIKMTIEEE
jgi:hypothetical protein